MHTQVLETPTALQEREEYMAAMMNCVETFFNGLAAELTLQGCAGQQPPTTAGTTGAYIIQSL